MTTDTMTPATPLPDGSSPDGSPLPGPGTAGRAAGAPRERAAGRRRRRVGLVAAAVLAAGTALTLTLPTSSAATLNPSEGILCDDTGVVSGGSSSISFSLDATDGYITEPDGNSIYMWSYGDSSKGFQLPGPTLCVTAGQTVSVVLHNTLAEDTSIIFSGQQVSTGGHPVQPQFTTAGDPGTPMTSLVDVAAKSGGSITYQFTAGAPGTYLYGSGTDVTKQRQMGLYGALVVRPSGHVNTTLHSDWANTEAGSVFSTGHEYLYLLSEVDPALHQAVELGRSYDYSKIVPRYFLLNGRSMPDTLAPNNAAWLPSQPYGGLVHIQPYECYPDGHGGCLDASTTPAAPSYPNGQSKDNHLPALIRFLNAGSVTYPWHPHGSDERVITRDGVPLKAADGSDSSYLKYLIDVGPGQSVDALLTWSNEYDPNGKTIAQGGTCSDLPGGTNRCGSIPPDVQLPQLQDQIVGPGTETWFSENPYLGSPAYGNNPAGNGPIPNGMVQNNQCGEYYQIAHNHALYQATNYGASFGGQMTLYRIDPPGGC